MGKKLWRNCEIDSGLQKISPTKKKVLDSSTFYDLSRKIKIFLRYFMRKLLRNCRFSHFRSSAFKKSEVTEEKSLPSDTSKLLTSTAEKSVDVIKSTVMAPAFIRKFVGIYIFVSTCYSMLTIFADDNCYLLNQLDTVWLFTSFSLENGINNG